MAGAEGEEGLVIFAAFWMFVGLTLGYLVGVVTAVLAHERAELERQEQIMRAIAEQDRLDAGELPEMGQPEFRGGRP